MSDEIIFQAIIGLSRTKAVGDDIVDRGNINLKLKNCDRGLWFVGTSVVSIMIETFSV